MIERELVANWNSVMYPEPEPIESMPETYGEEQAQEILLAQAPVDDQPGFGGVSPGRFARGVADTSAGLVKGAVQGFVGLPGDLESIGRLLVNLVGGDVSEEAFLATTDDIKKMLDKYAPLNARMGEREQMVTETIGEFASPGGYVKGAKEAIRGVKAGAKALAPKAGEMVEDYLTKSGMILRLGPEGKAVEVPSAGDVSKPAFKRWFGESKVVDASGKPLIAYHGTIQDVGEFKEGVSRNISFTEGAKGFYFSADPDVASGYATYPMLTKDKQGGNVLPVFLSIKNPLRLESGSIEQTIITPKDLEKYKSQGYDGIVVGDFEEIVVFEPTQIKSVFNKGTWNPNDPRILNSIGGGGVAVGGTSATMQQSQQEPK
jgi:hypothetical protein